MRKPTQIANSFRPIRNPILQWVLKVIPLGILGFVLVDGLLTQLYVADNPMFLTGLLSAALAAFLFRTLLDQVPETLDSLWARKVLKLKSEMPIKEAEKQTLVGRLLRWLPETWWECPEKPEAGRELGQVYCAFVDSFEDHLNHWASWVLGLFFASIMYVSFPLRLDQGWTFNWMRVMVHRWGWWPLIGSVSQIAIAYILGLFVWRMIVIAWKVRRLGHVFDFDIQVQHPDKSGGLKPLGDLCFSNALVISVPGVFLAGWAIAVQHLDISRYTLWASFYQQLLLVLVVLAFLAFFHPLFAVHRAMVRQQTRIRRQLDELSLQIDKLAQMLLDKADTLGAERGEELSKELALLQQVYQNNSAIPVWPFDKNIVLKFISSQAIPLLSLTGIGPSVLNVLESMLKFVEP